MFIEEYLEYILMNNYSSTKEHLVTTSLNTETVH